MADFGEVINGQLAGRTVRFTPLVKFDFASGAMFLWPGAGDLAIGGDTYQGIGSLGTLSAISQGSAGAIEEMTFAVFGDEGLLEHLQEDAEVSEGRLVTVRVQFFDVRRFDDDGNFVDWKTLNDPWTVFEGNMGPLTVKRQPPSDDGRATRVVSVSAQNFLIYRGRTPPLAYWSDRAQRAKYPTDNLFSRMTDYAFAATKWPQFS
jgi:hypothetical protein